MFDVTPPSPEPRRVKTPSWFDPRLVLGIVLVLGSVALGAIVVSRADSSTSVAAVSHDLAAGTVLTAADVHPTRVRLQSTASLYVPAGTSVVGQTLARSLRSGELLARSAVGPTPNTETTLTVPVRPENAPDVKRGQRIAVWVSTQYCQAVLVIGDVVVQDVRQAGTGALSAASDESLVVRAPAALAQRVVTALGLEGATLRVGVLGGSASLRANDDLPTLTTCLAPSRAS
jgi:SAF domain